MAFDTYMHIEGIPGESFDEVFKNWIELSDFDVGASQSASVSTTSAGGASSGRTTMSDFFFRKTVDKSTPKLHEACCSGKHFNEVTIAVNRAGEEKIKYLEIKLEEVMISSVSLNANGAAENGFPTETIRLNYGRIKMLYTQQKRSDGQGGGQVAGGWDGIKNKVYA
ncbi:MULTISPECIES: Hcp family type VI secretion system effector [Pseudomonas]|uniref:Putative type VI secretion system effector, Hcp1 family n=1 Tax=Pseudomonas congelans TaxID=200452 RepID=A0A0P9M4I5_9PSED|nr:MULTISPECIES: type VI secretion system tube protein Hcp [Pseudomonas]KFE45317.1 fimbrial protein [Pseudomonas congelans]KPW86275.1 putative type VI secretion system effector, Hcp1 family [Pseudomonas congelans]MBC8803220.1 type VI secretion system tube protein Hcp [Pseudomonas congelans]MBP1143687.1 type VI secretion system secreted protein Hcp [Pseudomonas sp. PvP027]MCF5165100.1 type VI secretion system tube protein Hcp [Pseudomonas congelans]